MSKSNHPLLVVGVGASAGGLVALKRFFSTIPSNAPIAFIVVQHLDPNHKSMMANILGRHTPISFTQAEHGQLIESGCGYIIPPNAYIEVIDHTIQLIEHQHQRGSRLAIDHLFRSMAEVYQSKAVGLLFSGSGSDGTAGLRTIKASGGLSIVQNPKTAEYPSMPRSAIDAGVVDKVLELEDIYQMLVAYAKHPYHEMNEKHSKNLNAEQLTTITSLLRAQENFDLVQFKETTVQRRLFRRMSLTSKIDCKSYINLLTESNQERQFLMRDLLINVTDFFRDKDAFEILDNQVINKIVHDAIEGSEIRVWIAGCASGEEAYTVAILVSEEIQSSKKDLTLKIFATDIDEEAIKVARKGIYPKSIVSELPAYFVEKYFVEKEDDYFVVRSNLRDFISFATQNVYTDPPFSKLHLVCCRNLLIYLRKAVQQKVLKSFYFSLVNSGFLFLGSSENLGDHKKLFKTISQKWRIFSRREQDYQLKPHSVLPSFYYKSKKIETVERRHETNLKSNDRAKLLLLNALPPSVLLDENNRVLYFHGNLNKFLQLPEGEAELNFFSMLAPELRTLVRSGIFKSKKLGQQVTINPAKATDQTAPTFKTVVSPLAENDSFIASVIISFEEVEIEDNQSVKQHMLLDTQDQEIMIRAMELELLDTKEELETSTEELKAAHEEALSTNEELQSSNEELEASTEELRSLNEELTTVNAQLKDKIDELSNTHDDIKNFFASTNLATIFLSNELKVKRFTPAAERLLRIGSQDINKQLEEISSQFIEEVTIAEAKKVVECLEPSALEIQFNGRWYLQKILPYQTEERMVNGVVLTFNDITHLKTAVNDLQVSGKLHAVIAKLGIKALSTDNIDNLMDQMVREITHTLSVEFSKVLEYIPKQNRLLLKAGIGWDKGLVGCTYVDDNKGSQAGFTLNSGGPVIVEDLANETRFSGSELFTRHKVVSGMSCVIEDGEFPYGILSVHSKKKRMFTQDDTHFLVSVANILSVAIHRKTIEAKLRENENRLRIAKDSNQMGSFEFGIETGETSWDDLLLDIWGLDSDEVTQDNFIQQVHPEDIELVTDAIEKSISPSGNGHYQAIYRVINRKTKKLSWVEATGQVILEHDTPKKMIGMVIDITEKMKLESSLKAAVSQLQQADEKKNEFLATLGHEIRNPLAAINSGVQIIEKDRQHLPRAVSMIESNVNVISSLLDDLLDITRISRGQIELNKHLVDVKEILLEIYEGFASKFALKRQKTTISLPDKNVDAIVDKIRIQQVISNIINNAHKFTPDNGEIHIELTATTDILELSVTDNGVGLDMAFKDKIFEPFHQVNFMTKKGIPGMGIGLSLVKQFVLLHDGSVKVESNGVGTGSKFIITLPVVKHSAEDLSSLNANQNLENQAIKTSNLPLLQILIVDDNEDAAYGLSLLIELKGCQVHTCSTGASALVAYNDCKPNVVILDIGLPDMTGYDLLKRIKPNANTDLLSIALTGYGHKQAKENSKQAGFAFHINKPVNFDNLLGILSKHADSIRLKI